MITVTKEELQKMSVDIRAAVRFGEKFCEAHGDKVIDKHNDDVMSGIVLSLSALFKLYGHHESPEHKRTGEDCGDKLAACIVFLLCSLKESGSGAPPIKNVGDLWSNS